ERTLIRRDPLALLAERGVVGRQLLTLPLDLRQLHVQRRLPFVELSAVSFHLRGEGVEFLLPTGELLGLLAQRRGVLVRVALVVLELAEPLLQLADQTQHLIGVRSFRRRGGRNLLGATHARRLGYVGTATALSTCHTADLSGPGATIGSTSPPD